MEVIRKAELEQIIGAWQRKPYGKFLISGSRGSGKSFLLKRLSNILRGMGKNIIYKQADFVITNVERKEVYENTVF